MKILVKGLKFFLMVALVATLVNCTSGGDGENTPGDGGSDAGPDKVAVRKCKADPDCKKDEFCKKGVCAAVPSSCKTSADCGALRNCQGGKCVDLVCRFDDQCPDGFSCNAKTGKCETSVKCDDKRRCPAGWVCNTCRGVCTISQGTDKCNEDFNCVSGGGSELMWCDKCIKECRPRQKLCSPCVKDDECGDPEDLCLPDLLNPQSGLKFCGRRCSNGFCAPGYKCKKFDGLKYPYQCVPASGDCKNPAECQDDGDCRGQGKICDRRTKLCVAGCKEDENCPVKIGDKCTADGDCKNSQAKCVNGRCSVQQSCCRGVCGSPCKTDSECDSQEKCDGGCCKLEGECKTSKDCPEKEYCDNQTGLCTPGCQQASDCGLPDPKKNRCRFKCENNKCVEDCKCRNPQLDCPPVRFCPKKEKGDGTTPCRKPDGPICKACSSNVDCGCKDGDDCKFKCTKVECKSDDDCKSLKNGANKCYNGRCSTKKVCRKNSDCPAGEKCENNFCAENCNNICLQLQSGNRCFTGCDPKGDGSECPSRLGCIELLPQSASGPKCPGGGPSCTADSDCPSKQPKCGPDGFCTACATGKVCRNLDQKDPTNWICINMPPTICGSTGGDICKEGGF